VSLLLNLLEQSPGQWVNLASIQRADLRNARNIDAEADRLNALGFAVETNGERAWRIGLGASRFVSSLLGYEQRTRRIGQRIIVLDRTSSTNDDSWRMAESEPSDGLVIFAESQSAGRGRRGAKWYGGRSQSLLLSCVLSGQDESFYRTASAMAAQAVAETVAAVTGLEPRIKRPNDVLLQGRKISGVLVETRRIGGRLVGVLGIGLNCHQTQECFPPELHYAAGSLLSESGRQFDRLILARRLLRRLDQWLG
jgi:BirA family biotin operon repressor/biotin-[acetyl-CoA-carboxylase] ligase